MSDRVTCTLQLIGQIDPDRVEALIEAMGQGDAGPEADSVRAPASDARTLVSFYDMKYGGMDDQLERALQTEFGLSYAWAWDPTDEFPAGVTVYDHDTGKFAEYVTADGRIVLGLNACEDPGAVKLAKRYQAFMDNGRLYVEKPTPPVKLACGNCGWHGDERQVDPEFEHVFQRVFPGEIMPYGECPDCGALVHPAEPGGAS